MINTMLKNIKEIHPATVVLIQFGAFYHAYGRDAYILSYLFGYQIKSAENKYNTIGFPKDSLNKVLKVLEDNNINYLTSIKSQNYEVEREMKYKDKNKYAELYDKAYRYVTVKSRINEIYNYLIENIDSPNIKEKLRIIEETIRGE